MKSIISVSRRTDIPAFYGDWFMNRLKEGFAGVVNPFGGQKYIVSLKPQDVRCFVFWSKNFTPFLENLKVIENSISTIPSQACRIFLRGILIKNLQWRLSNSSAGYIHQSISTGDSTRSLFRMSVTGIFS